MTTILLIVNLLAIAAIGYFTITHFKAKKDEEQSGLDKFRTDMQSQFHNNSEAMRSEIRHLQTQLTDQMKNQSGILQITNTDMNKRLDKAAEVIGNVQKELGRVSSLVKSVDDLQNILKAPKLRGNIGELFLGDLLANILPTGRFELQHKFKDGETVDAAIFIGDRIVPIDAKFPLENFRKIVAESNDSNEEITKQARRNFVNDVKKHIQDVSKYIRMDENTYDFALMYIPAENIYYEITAKEDIGGTEILSYSMKHKVIPVSPNTFYAYLMTIMLGLKGMEIERHAGKIMEQMGRVHKEFDTFKGVYKKIGSHLENARKAYDDADKRIGKIDSKLDTFAESDIAAAVEDGAEILEITDSSDSTVQ